MCVCVCVRVCVRVRVCVCVCVRHQYSGIALPAAVCTFNNGTKRITQSESINIEMQIKDHLNNNTNECNQIYKTKQINNS